MNSFNDIEIIKENEAVNKLPTKNVLLGNGFSRTYWGGFNYKSLLDCFGEKPVGRYLQTKSLFSKLETVNFEEVLRAIFHAYLVSLDNQEATKTLYLDVRNALISSVNKIHPKWDDVPVEWIGKCLSKYSNIFTTNYDLLPYWAILNKQSERFVDYFFKEMKFDPRDTDVYWNKTPIHFLHGAIHLRSRTRYDAVKINLRPDSGLEGVFDFKFMEDFPLFITEGRSEMKLSRIRENNYLNFCYEKLRQSEGGVTVYGHDLNEEYDGHIVEALKESRNQPIAVSVFSDLNPSDKQKFAYRISRLFIGSNKEVVFFESAAHSFSNSKKKPDFPFY